jgi:hypothetical protein
MFYIDIWGFTNDPLYLGYNSVEQETFFFYFSLSGTYTELNWARISGTSIFHHEKNLERLDLTGEAGRPNGGVVARCKSEGFMCMRSLQRTVRSPRIPKLMGRPSNSSTRPCTQHPPQRLMVGFPGLSASPSCALHTYTHCAQDTRVEYSLNITTWLCMTQKMKIRFIYIATL